MIPYPSALEHFMVIFTLLPLPFRAFILTFWVLLVGIFILRYFASK